MGLRAVALIVLHAVILAGAGDALAATARSAGISPPAIDGPLYKGSMLRCIKGPAGGIVAWERDRQTIPGAGSAAYLVTGGSVDHQLVSGVPTTGPAGGAETFSSAAVLI